jgi:excisionase family DNA binding protein
MANLMTLQEVAKELALSIHTLRAWTYQKRFPIVKLGRRVLLKREDVEAFVDENVIDAKKHSLRSIEQV